MEEKFLLEANTFITPFQNYYSFDLVSGFWRQLKPKLNLDSVYVLDVARKFNVKCVNLFYFHLKMNIAWL